MSLFKNIKKAVSSVVPSPIIIDFEKGGGRRVAGNWKNKSKYRTEDNAWNDNDWISDYNDGGHEWNNGTN